MPTRTKRICIQPGCGVLTTWGRCSEHRAAARGSAWQRGYRYDWLLYSRRFRKRYPLCGMGPRWPTPKFEGAPVGCLAKRKLTAGTKKKPHHVDHIRPCRRDENPKLFWDPWNHQNLCPECHLVKGKSERG